MTTAEKVLSVLESYGLKPAGTGKYRANSPLRPGSNSHAFSLVVEADGEHGGYYDHVSKDKGSLYELAELLHIEVPRRTVENTKRAYKDLEDYAAAHGVEGSVLTAAGWQQTTHGGRLALSFPTQNGTRYRFLDDQKPTYINEVGYKSCWYGLSRAVDMARKGGEALILCNGEISTVVAQHYGLPACCVTSGEKRIPDPLVDTLKTAWNGEVWLALDCDSAGRAAMREIAQQLPSTKLLDLGLSTGGDLADFCRLYGQEVSSALAKCIVPEIRDEETSTAPAYTSDDEALEIYIRELNGELVPEAQPLINPFNFLHAVGGLGHVIPPGKLLYFVSVSGGTKTIAFETGWQRYQRDGIHSIVYSPEWVDDRGAVEMAARAVQRAGGASFTDRMLHSLWQIEQHNRIENGHGVQMPSNEVSRSIARAEMLKRWPGRVFFLKEPGQSVEKLCAQIEAVCDLEAAKGRVLRAAWLDFAQLLWTEKSEGSGRIWIEVAMNLFKDTCRRKNLVGFVSSQMKKSDAELAKTGGELDSDMMQWLSEQQANFIFAFVPRYVNGERQTVEVGGKPLTVLRGKVLKNSLNALSGKEIDIYFNPERLTWMDAPVSTAPVRQQNVDFLS